jgi:type I restriction-modification system DNA methylase subunit
MRPKHIPDAYDSTVYKTERTCCAKVAEWINRIIEDNHLDLGPAEVETRSKDDKYPDIIIHSTPRIDDIACVMEFKPPYFTDPINEEELKEPARKKATYRHSPYFVTSNFQEIIWWNTANVNSAKPEHEQFMHRYILSQIEDLNQIEEFRYKESIKRGLGQFILKLYAVFNETEPEPKHAIDDILIYLLQIKIHRLARLYRDIVEDECCKNKNFLKELKKWFNEQNWNFAWQSQDFDKVARQTAYLLINKILFYDLLQVKRPHELPPLEIPEGLLKGAQLQKILQSFFDEVLKIDYETIYTTDFIDYIAFPEAKEVIKEIKELVKILRQYDFSKLGYDVVGRIFEQLIPQEERHNLGQYFTSSDIVDLILKFCTHHENDKIFDPACGAGTFLVRAYQHKKTMNARLEHEKILETLWGNDIAKFPATLSTINLAINDLAVEKNYPNILQEDFFAILAGPEGFEPENWRKRRAKTLGLKEREVFYPRWFDAIVGNPPYTRQEEIPEIGVNKEKLIESALKVGTRKIADIGKRSGIHAYFFVHGTKFLKDGGYFGFIVSNSWLDVDYGKGLQEFFLNNYKIIAIIESKVERWFEEADINTCIIILQKCRNKREREENLVRFVYLKKKLRDFIPPAQDMWEKQVERLNEIEKLKRTILAHNELYENEDLRIFPISQKELWEEGFDNEENKYIGAKWGKYLRAPEIFFKIFEKGKGKLMPLKKMAEVRRGFTTGANEFFYLTEEEIKRRGIEKEFWMHKDEKGNWIPNYVIKSPRECKSIVVNPKDLKYRVLMIHKDKKDLKRTNILKYIEEGERKGFHKRPTCASKERWYDLGRRPFAIYFWNEFFYERNLTFESHLDIYESDKHYGILPHIKGRKRLIIGAYLNSSLIPLFRLVSGFQALGEGVLKMAVYEVKDFPVINPNLVQDWKQIEKAFRELTKRKIGTLYDELGASAPEAISLDKVKTDRRELDKIVMGEILGLTEEEQLEVYRAVVDLVKSRIEKAKSFGNKTKTKEGIDVDALKDSIIERIKKVS